VRPAIGETGDVARAAQGVPVVRRVWHRTARVYTACRQSPRMIELIVVARRRRT
jgi:hypothetical protein